MRVYCRECGEKGRITNTNRMALDYAELYCQCCDTTCGHRWVESLGYKHVLSPSAKTTSEMVSHFSRTLSPEKRRDLLRDMGGAR